ncbi:NYN domain-containing protein [Dietzia cinnamea]|uniref:NYN domain-containing protein n=2 Tax=Dietziaceae TaxID=85029 RepID=UPI0007733977|nr:NYN domain-containing protein [Dietzia cinnamea]MCT2140987.1 NYN domain-containing protein [Dietzia cinnamea]MCT2144374.1 NYN domain-containing protein [Dietzia cinnamea]MCT2173081.1 NYN domain-containing protein [Dietzia cinnamea]
MNMNTYTVPLTQNIGLLYDGWNFLRGADTILGFGQSIDDHVLNLGSISELIAGERNRPSRVARITVVIGLHHQRQNPHARAITEQYIRYWRRDRRITVIAMENNLDGKEKGVDMELGMQLLEMTGDRTLDAVVLCSADRDMQPRVRCPQDVEGDGPRRPPGRPLHR